MTRPLRVAVVARSDGSHGGAGQVAETLAAGLRQRGHDVRWFAKVSTRDPSMAPLASLPGDALVRQLVGADPAGVQLLAGLARARPDVVHIHDPGVAFGRRVVGLVARRWPTLVTLHDFSLIYGGCVAPVDCERGPSGCGGCPQVGIWPLVAPIDLSQRTARRNRRLATRLRAVCPSAWLADRAATGAFAGRRPDVIPNALDAAFTEGPLPGPHTAPAGDAPVRVLVVATRLHDPGKGVDLARAACAALGRPVRLELAGLGEPPPAPPTPGVDEHVHGAVWDRAALRALYEQADLVVVPSRLESFGLTAAEALCCGARVATTPAGALPEVVADTPQAVVARDISAAALADAMREALALPAFDRAAAATTARQHFGVGRFLDAHEELYRELVGR